MSLSLSASLSLSLSVFLFLESEHRQFGDLWSCSQHEKSWIPLKTCLCRVLESLHTTGGNKHTRDLSWRGDGRGDQREGEKEGKEDQYEREENAEKERERRDNDEGPREVKGWWQEIRMKVGEEKVEKGCENEEKRVRVWRVGDDGEKSEVGKRATKVWWMYAKRSDEKDELW